MPLNNSAGTLCATSGEFNAKERSAGTTREQRRLKRISSNFPHTRKLGLIQITCLVILSEALLSY
jgi:hypothetical protein